MKTIDGPKLKVAQKLFAVGKVRIRWIVYCLTEKIALKMCFNGMEKKDILLRSAIETPNTFYAKDKRNRITGILR